MIRTIEGRSFFNLCFSDEDYKSVFRLIHALTKKIQAKVTFKWGVKTIKSSKILKSMLMARLGRVPAIMKELAYVPKIMKGATVGEGYNTLIFVLKNNRKSQGRR